MTSRSPIAIAALLMLAACGHSAPTRLLQLEPAPPMAPAGTPYAGPPVKVSAVHLPAALDRTEFVSSPEAGALEIHDRDHWAAALGTLAREALIRDLAARLPSGSVLPPDASAPGAVRVDVAILALTAGAGGTRLEAVVTILPPGDHAAPRRRPITLTDPAILPPDKARHGQPSPMPLEQARAYGRLLGSLADAIAVQLSANA